MAEIVYSEEARKLIEQHRAVQVSRDRGEIQARLWEVLRRDHGYSGTSRRKAVHKALGVSTEQVEVFYRLTMLGAVANPFWDRLDNGMGLSVVRRLLPRLSVTRVDGSTMEEAVATLLREYDAVPCVRRIGDKVVRYRPGKRNPRSRAAALRFWGYIRSEMRRYIKPSLAGLMEAESLAAIRDFELDLKALLEEWNQRLDRMVKESRGRASVDAIGRGVVLDACAALGVDSPKRDAPVDLDFCGRRKRTLLRDAHPDRGGDPEVFRATVEAYDILKQYNDQLRKRR